MTGRGDDFWLQKLEAMQAQIAQCNERLATIQAHLSSQEKNIERFYSDRMAPLEKAVAENAEFRQKSLGGIRLALVVLSIVGASILGTGGWMIRTTLLLEERGAQTSQRMDALSEEVASLETMLRRIGDD